MPALALAAVLAASSPLIDGWRVEPVPEAPGSCKARRAGAELNLTLLINKVGKPVLVISRPEWSNGGDKAATTVSIDGGAPQALEMMPLGPLYLGLIDDPALAEAFKTGKSVVWTVPQGRFRAEIAGLGQAAEDIRACEAAAKKG
jgi:hypothetical protein